MTISFHEKGKFQVQARRRVSACGVFDATTGQEVIQPGGSFSARACK
jgi:hypothetical protein